MKERKATLYRTSSVNLMRHVLTVSQLTAQIKSLIEEVFEDIYVVGEISNAKIYPSGHWYFSLKDKEATLPCVSFKSSNQSIKFRLEDGLMMVARGRLSVYPPKGGYQMVVSSLEPVGKGDWQLAFEQLKNALEKDGLLDPARKRPIPPLPSRIGVVTSPAGAAIKDILSALARRNKNVSVVIAPAKVQGEGSAEEVVQALLDLQQIEAIEVIIVARGGGSIEDIWSFNTEIVARAVANCRIPVISGIGHETDVTICDLVADMRAPTPTAAAELVSRGLAEVLEKCSYLKARLESALFDKLATCRRSLQQSNPVNFLNAYQARLHRHRLELRHQQERISLLINRMLVENKYRLRENRHKLVALGPMKVLSRGFSVLRKAEGVVVRSINQVEPGDVLEALLEEGKLTLVVQSKTQNWS